MARSQVEMDLPAGADRGSKKAWRNAFKGVLASLDQHVITSQSSDARDKLQTLAIYHRATSISVFLSMPYGELQTHHIVRDALQAGKKVYVPFIRKDPVAMDMLLLKDEADFDALRPDKWGIPSLDPSTVDDRPNCMGFWGLDPERPLAHSEGGGLDLILMPGVAFDEKFGRLGHGRGYYDRFLKRYVESRGGKGAHVRPFSCKFLSCPSTPSMGDIFAVGLALEHQLLCAPDQLPMNTWDYRVDAILAGGKLLSQEPLQ